MAKAGRKPWLSCWSLLWRCVSCLSSACGLADQNMAELLVYGLGLILFTVVGFVFGLIVGRSL